VSGSEDDAGWVRTGQRKLFESEWYNVRQDDIRLPDGQTIEYHVVEHPGSVMVVPLLDDGRIVMERIYRWPLRKWMFECPSGALEGDSPEQAARRELEEETGYRAHHLESLGSFAASDGYSNERLHLFLARGVRREGDARLESTEAIETQLWDFTELHAMAERGEIEDAPTALAILLARVRLSQAPSNS
jgi:ADP-ribose pyrophosphatase